MNCEIEGDGIFGDIYDGIKKVGHRVRDISSKVIHGRNSLSPKVTRILEQYNKNIIIGIKIGRTPVNSIITGIIKTVSNTPYDKLFHLFLVLYLDNGESLLLEKNEVINMSVDPHIKGEYISLNNIPRNLTVDELIRNTEKRMGQHKFLSYNSYDNNCQHFIKNVLQANDITEGLDFVKQDTEHIFKENTNFRKLANTVTDLAGRADVVMQGGEIDEQNNGLYGDEILEILKKKGFYINGVFSKDQLPDILKSGWYVINLQSTDEGDRKGTHWTCFKSVGDGHIIEYFDGFGFPPPNEVMERSNGEIIYSSKEIQDINSTCCGWFCIGAIISDGHGYGTPENHFKKYISMFSRNTHINDRILSNYLHNKGV